MVSLTTCSFGQAMWFFEHFPLSAGVSGGPLSKLGVIFTKSDFTATFQTGYGVSSRCNDIVLMRDIEEGHSSSVAFSSHVSASMTIGNTRSSLGSTLQMHQAKKTAPKQGLSRPETADSCLQPLPANSVEAQQVATFVQWLLPRLGVSAMA